MHFQRLHRWLILHPGCSLALGCVLLVTSGFLLAAHARAVGTVRDHAAPLIAEIPDLERRKNFLKQQLEMAELHAALRTGSQDERIAVFALPEESDLDRLLAVFDILQDVLGNEGRLAQMSPIEIGDVGSTEIDGVVAQTLSVQVALNEEGLQDVLLLLRLAGLLTIGDVLTPEDLTQLLDLTEAENPAGLIALEQFLSTDLLQYAREPRSYDEQLLRSFSSPIFTQAFQTALQSPLLRDARRLLAGSIGRALYAQELWPLQILDVSEVVIAKGGTEGWYWVGLDLELLSRHAA